MPRACTSIVADSGGIDEVLFRSPESKHLDRLVARQSFPDLHDAVSEDGDGPVDASNDGRPQAPTAPPDAGQRIARSLVARRSMDRVRVGRVRCRGSLCPRLSTVGRPMADFHCEEVRVLAGAAMDRELFFLSTDGQTHGRGCDARFNAAIRYSATDPLRARSRRFFRQPGRTVPRVDSGGRRARSPAPRRLELGHRAASLAALRLAPLAQGRLCNFFGLVTANTVLLDRFAWPIAGTLDIHRARGTRHKRCDRSLRDALLGRRPARADRRPTDVSMVAITSRCRRPSASDGSPTDEARGNAISPARSA